MIGASRVLGVITARGGSKGLPGKNVRPFLGKPLLEWTVDAGKRSRYLDRLILSSDDESIIDVAKRCGCDVPFVRPKELATDEATSIDTVRHALTQTEPADVVVILQPTSPLRLPSDIDRSIEDCVENDRPCTLTVSQLAKPVEWSFRMSSRGTLLPVLQQHASPQRRQEYEAIYGINGAVYAVRVPWIQHNDSLLTPDTGAVVMPKERAIDIDDEVDFVVAEALARYVRERVCAE